MRRFLSKLKTILAQGGATSSKRYNFDFAAAAPMDKEVAELFHRLSVASWHNPSSLYREGVEARTLLSDARLAFARSVTVKDSEIFFLGSGTESVNAALRGCVLCDHGITSPEVITTKLEHSAVLETLIALEQAGQVTIRYADHHSDGRVDLESLKSLLNENTLLVSVIHVNNEIGTINDLGAIARITRKHRQQLGTAFPYLHSDSAQSPLWLKLDVRSLGVDMLSLDSAKFGGPKGAGVLFVDKSIKLKPLVYGGGQENGLRSATENVPAIAASARAFAKAQEKATETSEKISLVRDYLMDELSAIEGVTINGVVAQDKKVYGRVANNVSVTFTGVDAEFLLFKLDNNGFCVSLGSACSGQVKDSNKETYSHVIAAVAGPEAARSTIRLTLAPDMSKSDVDKLIESLKLHLNN